MPRTRPPIDLGRLLLAAVALIGVLLLLPAADNRFGLTLSLVGIVICALAVFYALSVLLALALETAAPAVQPRAAAEETPAEETPQVEIPAAEPPAVEVAMEAGAEAAAGETPSEPAIRIETGQGGRALPHTPAPAPEARPGLWARGRAAVLGWIDAHRAATVLIVMAAIVVLVWATLPAGVKLDQRLLEIGLALIAITLLAYLLRPVGDRPAAGSGLAGAASVSLPDDSLGRAAAWLWTLVRGLGSTPVMTWVANLIRALWSVIEAFLMMFVKTATTILPTSARLSDSDAKYNQQNTEKMTAMADTLGLPQAERDILVSHWIDQIVWTSSRANRERDANELIRWWQIILSSSIPIIGLLPSVPDANKTLFASLAGALVTVLTAMQQFRRPQERWHHYRKLTERMQAEYWAFVNLDEAIYKSALYDGRGRLKSRTAPDVRSAAFQIFHERMTRLKEEDLQVFFSQVAPAMAQPDQPPAQPGAGQGQGTSS